MYIDRFFGVYLVRRPVNDVEQFGVEAASSVAPPKGHDAGDELFVARPRQGPGGARQDATSAAWPFAVALETGQMSVSMVLILLSSDENEVSEERNEVEWGMGKEKGRLGAGRMVCLTLCFNIFHRMQVGELTCSFFWPV